MRFLSLVLLVPACASEVPFQTVTSETSTGASTGGGLTTTSEPTPTSSDSSGGANTGTSAGPTTQADTGELTGSETGDATGTQGTSSGEAGESSGSSGEVAIPSCNDGLVNQDETDVDCGGASCVSCTLGLHCLIDFDCLSTWCSGEVCTQPDCLADADCDAFDEPCKDATCDIDAKSCVVEPLADGLACEDANLCTSGQHCAAGACVGGTVTDCSDLDSSCGVGKCDAKTGECVGEAFLNTEGEVCDDGFVCTPNDTCMAGLCGVGGPGYLFFEDFSDPDPGWELGPLWEFGPAMQSPKGTNGWDPPEDHSPGDDNMVAGTLIGGLIPMAEQATTCLTSPVIDASEASSLWLTFWRHLHTDYFPFVQHTIEVFDGEWQNIETGYANPGIDDPEWTFQQYNISTFKNAALRVRICYSRDDSAFIHAGWSVDDLTVGPFVCTPEP